MEISPVLPGSLSGSGFSPDAKNTPEKIRDAATQFESLLIGEVLKTSHRSGSGSWMGTGEDDQSSASTMEMADDYFARAMASRGGLGLGRMAAEVVERRNAAETLKNTPGAL